MIEINVKAKYNYNRNVSLSLSKTYIKDALRQAQCDKLLKINLVLPIFHIF